MNSLTPTDAKPASAGTKRWLNFSLKTLLVVMTALAIWLGFYVKSFRDRKTAVAAIERLDGAMGFKYFGPEWLRTFVDDDKYFRDPAGVHVNRPLSVAELEGVLPYLMSFRRLQHLTLPGNTVSDESLHLLFPLVEKLTVLRLSDSPFSVAAIPHLKRFTKLQTFTLGSANISAAGLAELESTLPNCRIVATLGSETVTTAP